MLNYDNLANYYQTNFALMQHHKYSLSELENMIPWERQLYIDLLMKYLKEENDRIQSQRKSK
jgi:3-methyladenine DNA glycosylase AlkD